MERHIRAGWNNLYGSSAQINWLVSDHLGTPRIIIDKTGALANVKRHDYLPFGEELLAGTGGRTLANGYSGDNLRQKFTQKERDIETGLDFFGARYFSSVQGRFTSVDPIGVTFSRLVDPQQFNRYSYVRNNPLKYVDRDGRDLKLKAGMKRADVDRIIKTINPKIWNRYSYALNNPLRFSDPTGLLAQCIDATCNGWKLKKSPASLKANWHSSKGYRMLV